MTVSLMLHQRLGLGWMMKRERQRKQVSGGILADDQGLGKTVTSIALIVSNVPSGELRFSTSELRGGTLVVCPAVVLKQWEAELKNTLRPTAGVTVFVHHGKVRTRV